MDDDFSDMFAHTINAENPQNEGVIDINKDPAVILNQFVNNDLLDITQEMSDQDDSNVNTVPVSESFDERINQFEIASTGIQPAEEDYKAGSYSPSELFSLVLKGKVITNQSVMMTIMLWMFYIAISIVLFFSISDRGVFESDFWSILNIFGLLLFVIASHISVASVLAFGGKGFLVAATLFIVCMITVAIFAVVEPHEKEEEEQEQEDDKQSSSAETGTVINKSVEQIYV